MATAWGNPAVGGGRARSTATGKKKATEAGSHQSEASRKDREPASWRRRAGNTDPSTRRRHAGTGRGFASVGCVQGPWRSPWQAGAARWGQRSISQGSPSPRGPSTRAQGGRTLRAVGSQACHVAPTDRGTGEQPGREHLGGKGDQLGGAQPAFICRWEDPLAASFALRKPKLRVGPAARLGGDGAGTQLRPCP